MWKGRLARAVAAILVTALPVVAFADDTPAPPMGWVVFRTGSLGPNDLACASRASMAWEVSANGDHLVISPRRESPRDLVQWTRFAGGRLVGENNGEWGGGIWWSSVQGWRSSKISNENLVGFLQTRFGMLAFVGLDHMISRRGRILIIGWPLWGAGPDVSVLAELGEAPRGFAADRSGDVYVATGTRVLRISAPGSETALFAWNDGLPSPNSLAVTSTGVIAVGMRLFVLRLVPVANEHRAEWLLPSDCRRFAPVDFGCRCSAD